MKGELVIALKAQHCKKEKAEEIIRRIIDGISSAGLGTEDYGIKLDDDKKAVIVPNGKIRFYYGFNGLEIYADPIGKEMSPNFLVGGDLKTIRFFMPCKSMKNINGIKIPDLITMLWKNECGAKHIIFVSRERSAYYFSEIRATHIKKDKNKFVISGIKRISVGERHIEKFPDNWLLTIPREELRFKIE